jgi:hypothetical protein
LLERILLRRTGSARVQRRVAQRLAATGDVLHPGRIRADQGRRAKLLQR